MPSDIIETMIDANKPIVVANFEVVKGRRNTVEKGGKNGDWNPENSAKRERKANPVKSSR